MPTGLAGLLNKTKDTHAVSELRRWHQIDANRLANVADEAYKAIEKVPQRSPSSSSAKGPGKQ